MFIFELYVENIIDQLLPLYIIRKLILPVKKKFTRETRVMHGVIL